MSTEESDWKAGLTAPKADARYKTEVSYNCAQMKRGSSIQIQTIIVHVARPAPGRILYQTLSGSFTLQSKRALL